METLYVKVENRRSNSLGFGLYSTPCKTSVFTDGVQIPVKQDFVRIENATYVIVEMREPAPSGNRNYFYTYDFAGDLPAEWAHIKKGEWGMIYSQTEYAAEAYSVVPADHESAV